MNRPPLPGRQSGAALVVSLLLVLLTAVLGMSVMRIGTAELSMVNISERDRTAFHVADSAGDSVFDTLALENIAPSGETAIEVASIDERVDVTVTARHEGLLPEFGSSLRLFARAAYSIEARAAIDGTGTVRRVVAGASMRVPLAP